MRADRAEWSRRRALALAAACGLSCGAPVDSRTSPWTFLGEHSFAPSGALLLGPKLQIPGGAAGFAMLVEADACVQVARLKSEALVVRTLESGPSCKDCSERFSLIAGDGMLVHHPPQAGEGPAELVLGQMRCTTLTPARPSVDAPARFSAWWRPLPQLPAEAPVQLIFRHGPFSAQADRASTEALFRAVRALMAPAGIAATLRASDEAPAIPASTRWFEGDPAELAALVDPPSAPVQVVFAGCIERVHPELGSSTVLDGLVPRVPGLSATGAGIFLRGRDCFPGESAPVPWPVAVQARRVAHELGHFLGLYHSVEVNGESDKLPDTGRDDNLMAPNPNLVERPVFSPLQAARMRLHAALAAEGTPNPIDRPRP